MGISKYIKKMNEIHKNLLVSISTFTLLLFLTLNFKPEIFQGLAGEYFWPIYRGLIPFLATLLILLIVNKKHFKTWLLKIASWYVPLAILIVASTDVYGDMYSYGRSATAFILMSGLFIITVIFVTVIKVRQWRS